ncbi:MAG: tetratricopeptide repeat protein, partial [Bacteroidota bacterium]
MNYKSIIWFLLVLPLGALGQQDVKLPGVVVERNSQFYSGKVNYISNVSIKSVGAKPRLSDQNGEFTLLFSNKPVGNVARVYASKSGFALVNEEVLKAAAVVGRTSPLKIVMSQEDSLYYNQIAYYNIAKDAAIKSYEQKVRIPNKEGKEKDLLLAEMRVAFNQEIKTKDEALKLLEQQKNDLEKRATELADKFLTINLDDQSARYQRAFRAFLKEDIDGALAILDSVDLAKRLATNTADIQKVDSLIVGLEKTKDNKQTQIQQDIQQCDFKAQLHILKFEWAEAENMYELALEYDSQNNDRLFDFAYFLQSQNRYQKATQRYHQILTRYRKLAEANSAVYLPYVASTLNNLGNALTDQNDFGKGIPAYEEALTIYRKLAEANPAVYLSYVAGTLNNLGAALTDQNKYEKGIPVYEEVLIIRRKLAEANPAVYLPYVANTLNNLGNALTDQNDFEKGIPAYEEALTIYRKLAEANPAVYLPDVAGTLNNLGAALTDQSDFEKGIPVYKEALIIRRKLAEANPAVYLPDVATTLNNLGNALTAQNDF